MAELRWIQTCFSLLLGLQVTAVTGQTSSFSFIIVRAGDDVTLSCTYVIDVQRECDRTEWTFGGSTDTKLVARGKIVKKDFTSDRLRVTENCSLVLKNVSAGDAGRFECRQIDLGDIFHYSRFYLSVVTMTEHDDGNKVTLTCSVSFDGPRTYTAKWLYEGGAVGGGNTNVKTSQSKNSTTVTFPSSELRKTKNLESFQCQVSDHLSLKVQLFTFTAPTSGDDTTTTTTTTNGEKPGMDQTALPTLYVAVVAGGLAALLIAAVVLFMWRRRKGRRTHTDQDAEKPQQPDPDDGVSYASISYIKNKKQAGAQAPVRGEDGDDEGDAVTYSTVKVSSTHPSAIYATINKPQK